MATLHWHLSAPAWQLALAPALEHCQGSALQALAPPACPSRWAPPSTSECYWKALCGGSAGQLGAARALQEGPIMGACSRRACSAGAGGPWGAGACFGSAEGPGRCQVAGQLEEEAACSAAQPHDWGCHPCWAACYWQLAGCCCHTQARLWQCGNILDLICILADLQHSAVGNPEYPQVMPCDEPVGQYARR